MIPVYEAAGYGFPGWVPYERRKQMARRWWWCRVSARTLEASGKKTRLAYVSGWAALDKHGASRALRNCIPYSDHADFDELLGLVERSGAAEVDVVHGYTEAFARILSQRGVGGQGSRRAAAAWTEEDPGRLMDSLAATCEQVAR